MDPIISANIINKPIDRLRMLSEGSEPDTIDKPKIEDKFMALTAKILSGAENIFGGEIQKSIEGSDNGKAISRRNFLTGPIRAMRDGYENEVNTDIGTPGLFEQLNTEVDGLDGLTLQDLSEWKIWFMDKVSGLESAIDLENFLSSLGSGVAESVNNLTSGLIDRRLFLQGSSAVAGAAIINKSVPRLAPKASVQEVPQSEESHSSKISRVDLAMSGVVSAAFGGVIGAQFKGYLELSPKTSLLMSTLWGIKVLALKRDVQGKFGSDKEERAASQAALDHEMAELGNLRIAFALTGAAEVASHFYLDQKYGDINAEEIWKLLSNGKKIMVPLNGGTEQIELTFADLEAWLNIEVASEGYNDRTEMIKNIINGEGLDEIPDSEIAGIMEEWIADRRVETVLDKYEDARYEKSLIQSRLAGADLWTTIVRLNEIETDNIDDFRLAGHIRKWIKNRDGILDETRRIMITKDDLEGYLESREGELEFMGGETLDLEISKLEAKIREGVWKMNGMAAIFAPISLTFTSAGIVNGYMKEMAVRMYELNALRKLKDEGLDAEYHEESNKFAVDAMTGNWGLLHLMKSLATNIQGASLWGDPPNIFFVLNYGGSEWLKNSAYGFLLSSSLSALETNLFLKRSGLGLPEQEGWGIREYWNSLKYGGKSLVNTVMQGGSYITEKITGDSNNFIQRVAKERGLTKYDFINIDNENLLDGLGGKLSEMFYIDSMLGTFSKAFKGVHQGDIASAIKEAIPELDIDQETEAILESLKIDNFKDVEQMKAHLEGLGIFKDGEVDKIIEGFEASQAHDDHPHEHKLSHAALDVRNALLTQLWAVGSLQVVVKKLLGLDQDKQPGKIEAGAKIGAILGTIAGISGIADNVAAMLFGINVLEEIGRKTLGEEEYNKNKGFQEALRRWGFLTAVAAGDLTLIGNGPNMLLEVLESIYRDEETDVLDAITRKMVMSESVKNFHGPISVLMTLLLGFAEIGGSLAKAKVGEKSDSKTH